MTKSGRLFVILFVLFGLMVVAGLALIAKNFREPARTTIRLPRAVPATLNADAATEEPQRPALGENQIRIFFTTDGIQLHPQVIDVSEPLDPQERLRFALQELTRGPASDFFQSPLPPETALLGAYIVGDAAVVDVSGAIRARPLGGPLAEILCAYAIVNTVCENLRNVRTVRILVDGQPIPVLWDQLDISGPLAADTSLIRY